MKKCGMQKQLKEAMPTKVQLIKLYVVLTPLERIPFHQALVHHYLWYF
jgi:hypothetical protein